MIVGVCFRWKLPQPCQSSDDDPPVWADMQLNLDMQIKETADMLLEKERGIALMACGPPARYCPQPAALPSALQPVMVQKVGDMARLELLVRQQVELKA